MSWNQTLLAFTICWLITAGTTTTFAEPVKKSTQPNIVVVLADDLGYGDLACYGHKMVKTPHLDRLATEGIRLTNCYAASANCSPARTGLMTGRTPYRVGIHNWIPDHSPMHVRRNEITIATLLQKNGYATCHLGKWHLNGRFNLPDQPQPSDHGFDYWFSTQNNALPSHRDPNNYVRNGKPVGKLKGYSSHLVVDEAVHWLTKVRDKKKPFFMFVCFHEPHEPIASAKKYTDLYPDTGKRSAFNPGVSTLAAHHGNVTQMDAAFGRLSKTLDKLKLRDNTLLIVTSDNGPAITNYHPHGSAGPLRDKKGSMHEGGIRVPGFIRWPKHSKPGQVCHEPICGVDILPTLCEVTGVAIPKDRAIDGTSFLPIFAGQPIQRKTPLYWQFDAARSKAKVAMRIGDWKILAHLTGPPIKQTGHIIAEQQKLLKVAELSTFELYNLRDDIGETTDLAAKEPERLAAMSKQLRKLYREVRDESPTWPAWEWPHHDSHVINTHIKNLKKAAAVKADPKKP